jgi:hypothetical protein
LTAPRAVPLTGALLAVLGAVLLAACGSIAAPGSAAPGGGTSQTTSTSSGPAAKVALTVSFAGKGDSGLGSWTLRCDPPGGTFRDPAAACAAITSKPDLLFPSPVRAVCPMIMVDAPVAVVDGSYYGKTVHERIVDGGCDIARWNEIKQIFS